MLYGSRAHDASNPIVPTEVNHGIICSYETSGHWPIVRGYALIERPDDDLRCLALSRSWVRQPIRILGKHKEPGPKGPALGVTQTAGGLTSDFKIRSANRARNEPRCGPAGGGIRTRKSFRPEACETSAFAIFATPAVLTVTNHGNG